MTKTPPFEPKTEGRKFVTEKAIDDFERVYQRQSGKRFDADYANENDDD